MPAREKHQKSLKDENPRKYYLKFICNVLYYLGTPDCWYEDKKVKYPRFRKVYSVIAAIFGVSFIIDNLLANLRTDLTLKQKNDLLMYTFGYPTIALKIMMLYAKQKEIKEFLKTLLEVDVNDATKNLDKGIVKQARFVCTAILSSVLISASFLVCDAVKDYFLKGTLIEIEVLYYPNSSNTSIAANCLRFISIIHFWFIVINMMAVDCLSLCTLIFVKFKFIRVRIYFEGLADNFISTNDYKEKFKAGIKLHQHALWCAHNIQRTIGPIYSIQIIESILLLVIFLLRIIGAKSDKVLLLVCLGSYIVMITLTGLYMTYAANITHEALLIPNAVFHSGWENCRAEPGLRKVIVITLQQSQKPVNMTAFGVYSLTYKNFISILRSSYSFFVVMRDFDS